MHAFSAWRRQVLSISLEQQVKLDAEQACQPPARPLGVVRAQRSDGEQLLRAARFWRVQLLKANEQLDAGADRLRESTKQAYQTHTQQTW